MAKVIKYGDTSKIEGNREQAPVGLYFAKVVEITAKPSKNDEPMIEVVWEITKDAKGKKIKKPYARIWSYAPLDPEASWARRLKDLVTAFGLKDKGGNIATIEGKEALIRLREDTDQDGEYRPQIGKVLKPKVADEEEAEDEDVEEDEELDEEDEDQEEDDDEEEEDDEEEDDEEDDDEDDDLEGLSRTELKAIIKAEGLEVTVKKSMSDEDLAEAIREARPEDDDEEDDDDEEEGEEDNYDDMSLAELRQELKDRELDSKGKQAVLIARLRTDDEEEPV